MSITSFLKNPFATSDRSVVPVSTSTVDTANLPSDVRRMIKEHRYFQILEPAEGVTFDEESIAAARKAIESNMALVPAGNVWMIQQTAEEAVDGSLQINQKHSASEQVDAFYCDRLVVANADFERFVKSGGYTNAGLWPSEILPTVLQFVDQTGKPGPKFWTDGSPDINLLDHPVVGVSWYEANAYATWIGKQLPSAGQWQRTGTWGHSPDGSSEEATYPWGNTYDPTRVNLWGSGNHQTLPADSLPQGDTTNAIRQLVGNVWEWTSNAYVMSGVDGLQIELRQPMAEIRGGAFDTYFRSQATCRFRTGRALTARDHNIGFRCCRSIGQFTDSCDTEE